MKKYSLQYTVEAKNDLKHLSYIIKEQYKSPLTAVRYLNGIDKAIKKLSSSAESYSIQTRKSLQQYSPNPRRLNYKRMAIIYNVINDVVYIRRVIPSNIIAGL